MTPRQLARVLMTEEDPDGDIPINLAIWMMDPETEMRLKDFLSYLFLNSDDPAVQMEAMALITRLELP